MSTKSFTFAILFVLIWSLSASAHPVPKDSHDRTIVVRLQKSDRVERVQLRIEYRLEVDESTVYLNDMKEFRDEVNPLDYRGRPLEYYAQFTKIYAPIYADRFIVKVNKQSVGDLRCVSRNQTLHDEKGMNLGHLRCDFVFEGSFEVNPSEKFTFFFREQNYYLEEGQIHLQVINETSFGVESKQEASEAFRKRALEKPLAGDDEVLRESTWILAPNASGVPAKMVSPSELSVPAKTKDANSNQSHDERFSLLRLVLANDYGFFLTMLLALLFGAGHALTPGHGKTLVAAYLVGERGTVWHAVYLGLVTTLTHTGAVLILAVILTLWPNLSWIMPGLGLVMGLIVVCMGFWLLLQRLAGRADHVHLDSGPRESAAPRTLTWWGLTLLGVAGGMVPCWDAVGLLCITVGTREIWLVLPALVAFSAGLAAVLVVIGVAIVQVPRFAKSRWGGGAMVRALPIVSAIIVTLIGFWLCYEAVHGN